MTSQYAHIQWGMITIYNPIQDRDPSDTYATKNEIQWKQPGTYIMCPH